jgi:hypothetical protein
MTMDGVTKLSKQIITTIFMRGDLVVDMVPNRFVEFVVE